MAVTGCQIDAETSAMQQSAPSNAGDYEDLYNGYKRPMSPAPNSPTSSTGLGNLNPQSRAELERRGIILPHGYNDEQVCINLNTFFISSSKIQKNNLSLMRYV